MNDSIASCIKDWIPYKLFTQSKNLYCRWLYLGDKMFTEPFFDETISNCQTYPTNSQMRKCVSSMEILPQWLGVMDIIAPTAIIFHISRCGSTLVSQLLGIPPSNIILSEVPFFDDLLRWGHQNKNMQEATTLLKAAVGLYGVRRKKGQSHLFIKADSWHIHFYQQLRVLYPATPFILLYRSPDEVIHSQQKKRGMQSVPGILEPSIFGFSSEETSLTNLDEYMARVLETYLEAFIKIVKTDNYAIAFNFKEGGLSIINKIAAITGMEVTESEQKQMQQRSLYNAKYPENLFSESAVEGNLPPYLHKAMELYSKLEGIQATISALK
jgi:hypothetical protein